MTLLRRISVACVLCGALALIAGGAAGAYNLTYAGSADVQPRATAEARNECPPGFGSPWGGFSSQFGVDGGAEPTAFRVRGRGWQVLVANTSDEPRGVRIESYCDRPRRRRPVERSAAERLAPGTSAVVTARCRRGETLLAGGFRNSIDPRPGRHVVISGMRRVGVRNLRVTAVNLSLRESGRATAYAYCGHGRSTRVGRNTETVPPAASLRMVARCPERHRGEMSEVFFGFQASPANPQDGSVTTPAQFRHGAKGKVIVTAVNRSRTEPATMTAFAYCLVPRFR